MIKAAFRLDNYFGQTFLWNHKKLSMFNSLIGEISCICLMLFNFFLHSLIVFGQLLNYIILKEILFYYCSSYHGPGMGQIEVRRFWRKWICPWWKIPCRVHRIEWETCSDGLSSQSVRITTSPLCCRTASSIYLKITKFPYHYTMQISLKFAFHSS
jgi:hypothetical protein